ncbi:MAG: pseudouridine synthase, partial [Planctomycetales bacterium]|nr:pseudouridine synthase [Planctomycetales bacterium]
MRVIDLLPDKERIFTVGRLDKSSEGLMLVTNDGTLANRLAHPRYEIAKRYLVTVVGQPTQESLDILRRGIHLAEGRVQVQELTVKKRAPRQTTLEMVLTEGRNREIRRMAARVGHKVVGLKRIAIGPLRLMNMPTGAFRELTRHEVAQLYELAHLRGAPSAATDKQPAAVERPSSAARPTRRPTRKTSRRPEGAPPRRTTAKPTGRKSSYSHSRDNTGQNSEPSTRKPGKKKTPFGTRSSGRPATGGTTGRKPSGRKPSGRKPDGRKPYEKKPYGRKPHDSQKSNATGGTVIGGDDFEQERTESRTRSGRPNQQQRRGKFAKGKFAKGKSRRPSTDRGTQRGKRKGSR